MEAIDITLPLTCACIASYLSTLGCHSNIDDFVKDLSDDLKTKYYNLKCERRIILIIGFIISFFVAILYYKKYSLNTKLSTRRVNSVLIFVALPIFVYRLVPKSSYMLQESSLNIHDTKDWFKIYLCMKNAMMYSFIITFIVVFIIFKIFKPYLKMI